MPLKKTTEDKKKIVAELDPTWKVLDIGAAGAPCARADYVIDILPYKYYEEMGHTQLWGGSTPRFNKETWISQDICDHKPWPFPDKFFDYTICSHLLEDVRDPVWVCREMTRISKRGYVETPSKLYETSYGIEGQGKKLAGAEHHRWILEIYQDKLRITFKSAWVHLPWIAHHTPPKVEDKFLKFFWENEFECYEDVMLGGIHVLNFLTDRQNTQDQELTHFAKLLGYPPFLYRFHRKHPEVAKFFKKWLPI